MKRLTSGIRFITYQFLIGSVREIQTGGQNILRNWVLTQAIDSVIIAS
jgi:hypothetical protein